MSNALINTQDNFMTNEIHQSFYSVKAETQEEKIKLFNSINNPKHRLADFINKKIKVKDVLVEMVELENETTGEVEKCPRIILIDDKDESYQCVSLGVFSALKKIFVLFGVPTWDKAISIEIKQVTRKERKMLTLELV